MANQITKKLEINLIQNAQGLFLGKKKENLIELFLTEVRFFNLFQININVIQLPFYIYMRI